MSLGSIPHCCKAVDSTILSVDLLPGNRQFSTKVATAVGSAGRNALISLGDLRFGPLAFLFLHLGDHLKNRPMVISAKPANGDEPEQQRLYPAVAVQATVFGKRCLDRPETYPDETAVADPLFLSSDTIGATLASEDGAMRSVENSTMETS
jgi:hypothetical protein